MKAFLGLAFELLGFMGVAFFIGRYVDGYFSLKGYGTFALMILMYILWFFHLYKLYR